MKIIRNGVSLIFFILSLILTGLFVYQVYEILTKENRYRFLQIFLSSIWGIGALIFWFMTMALYKRNKKEIEE